MRVIAILVLFALASSASAKLVTRTVEYREGPTTLRGYIAYDDKTSGRRPGVLVVPEWWGLDDYARHRADQIAELGYVGFAVDMYGNGTTTDNPSRAGELAGPFRSDVKLTRARARAALDELRRSDLVDPDRIAIIGYCFGGTVALQLAYSSAPVVGAVSFHGDPKPPAADDISNIHAALLVLHGGNDPNVPLAKLAEFENALKPTKVDWEVAIFGGAMHSFSNPGADQRGMQGIRYDPRADRRSWALMQSFLKEVFAKQFASG